MRTLAYPLPLVRERALLGRLPFSLKLFGNKPLEERKVKCAEKEKDEKERVKSTRLKSCYGYFYA